MQKFSDIIDAIGIPELAKALKLGEGHVRIMRFRDSIPPLYWPDLVDAARRSRVKGVTFGLLKTLRDERFPPAPEPTRGSYKRKLEKCA